MRPFILIAGLLLLGGCAVYPATDGVVYGSSAGYYEPAYAYAPAPVYYGPTYVPYGGWYGWGHGHHDGWRGRDGHGGGDHDYRGKWNGSRGDRWHGR